MEVGQDAIVLRRFSDFGRTWDEMRIVHENGNDQIGNARPIVDQETGWIYGVTWSKGRNFSDMARKDDWYWYATGPAAGFKSRLESTRDGRILMR